MSSLNFKLSQIFCTLYIFRDEGLPEANDANHELFCCTTFNLVSGAKGACHPACVHVYFPVPSPARAHVIYCVILGV